MTLLELLVKELPKRGGWPKGAERAWQSGIDGELYFTGDEGSRIEYPRLWLGWSSDTGFDAGVTREQYETAIAAQQPVWNGEGLPPVGVECEYKFTKVNYRSDFSRGKVLDYGIQNVFMQHWLSGNEFSHSLDKIEFRPLLTEAERKREKIAKSLIQFLDSKTDIDNVFRTSDVIGFIDYIASGQIPGVRLDDE